MKKYLRAYYNIINKAFLEKRSRKDIIKYEAHHIKPKSLYKKSKLVLLTPREHYLTHFLLYKHFKANHNKNSMVKMSYAWNQMTWQSKDNITRYTSKTFAIARQRFSENMSGANHWAYGKVFTKEEKLKMSVAYHNMPKETFIKMKEKMRNAKLGTKLSEETKRKMSISRTGLTHNRVKYKVIKPDNTEEIIGSITRYAKLHNMSRTMINNNIGIKIKAKKGGKVTITTKNTLNYTFIKLTK